MAQAKAARKVSGTNMVERVPHKRKATAGGTGHNGAALASVLIQQAEAKAKAVTAEWKSLKERLAEIKLLSHEDHIEFRKAMVERQAQITNAAKLVNVNIMTYRSQNPEANTVYNACSEWMRLSEACDAGWNPDMTLGWNELKGLATQHLDKVAREKAIAEKAPTLQAAREAVLKSKIDATEKEAQIAKIDSQIAEAIKDVYKPRGRTTAGNALTSTAAPVAPSSAPVSEGSDTATVKITQITTMLKEQSVPVLLQVAKFLDEYMQSPLWKHRMEMYSRAEEERKAIEGKKPAGKKAEGVIGEEKQTVHRETAPAAKGTRRTSRKTAK